MRPKYSYSIISWDWSPKSLGPKYSATQTNQLQNQYYTTHHIPHQSLNLFTALQYKPMGNLKPYTKLFSTQIPSQLTSFQFSIFLFLFHLLIHVSISMCKIVSLCFCLWEPSPNINIHIFFLCERKIKSQFQCSNAVCEIKISVNKIVPTNHTSQLCPRLI